NSTAYLLQKACIQIGWGVCLRRVVGISFSRLQLSRICSRRVPFKQATEQTGATVSLVKKIDVEKYFAAKRTKRLDRTGPLSRVDIRMEPTATARSTLRPLGKMTPWNTLLQTSPLPRFRSHPILVVIDCSYRHEAGRREAAYGLPAQRMRPAKWIRSTPGAVFRRLGRGDRRTRARTGRQDPRSWLALHVDHEFPFV